MTDTPKIFILNRSKKDLLAEIDDLIKRCDIPVKVCISESGYNYVFEDLSVLKSAVETDLASYVINTFKIGRSVSIKQFEDGAVVLVDEYTEEGGKKKYRNPLMHLKPKKKKRK